MKTKVNFFLHISKKARFCQHGAAGESSQATSPMPNTAILEKARNWDPAQVFSARLPGWSLHKTALTQQSCLPAARTLSRENCHDRDFRPFGHHQAHPRALRKLWHLAFIGRVLRGMVFSSSERLCVLLHCTTQCCPWATLQSWRVKPARRLASSTPALREPLLSGRGKRRRATSGAVLRWRRGERDPWTAWSQVLGERWQRGARRAQCSLAQSTRFPCSAVSVKLFERNQVMQLHITPNEFTVIASCIV